RGRRDVRLQQRRRLPRRARLQHVLDEGGARLDDRVFDRDDRDRVRTDRLARAQRHALAPARGSGEAIMATVCVERAIKSFTREDGAEMRVLDGVSFDAKENGITCLLGPSGCGKSTLLNAIAGLDKLDAGEIQFRTPCSKLETRNPKLGYVFQDPRL